MSEPWSGDYRKLSIVPLVEGSTEAGYSAAYNVNRTDEDGKPVLLRHARCDGMFPSDLDAREAAEEAARNFIDGLLGAG
ncbi:hypothetical protein BH11PSE9_BH11PSE9_20090 [soil metagenome]